MDNRVVEIPAGVWFVGFLGSTSSALTQREIGEKADPICQPCETEWRASDALSLCNDSH